MTANGVPQFSCWEVSWPVLENFYLDTTQIMPQPASRRTVLASSSALRIPIEATSTASTAPASTA